MNIKILGDIHAETPLLYYLPDLKGADVVIQVGDFGIYPGVLDQYPQMFTDLPYKVYFIDGNHEDYNMLADIVESTNPEPDGTVKFMDNLYYVPRGTILDLGGRKFGFCGGAESVDYRMRVKGKDWFPEERVIQEDIEPLLNANIDILITHCPPDSVITRNFPPAYQSWDLPWGWVDKSAQMIETLWSSLGRPQLYCGHMHRSITDGTCRILDINEVVDCVSI